MYKIKDVNRSGIYGSNYHKTATIATPYKRPWQCEQLKVKSLDILTVYVQGTIWKDLNLLETAIGIEPL